MFSIRNSIARKFGALYALLIALLAGLAAVVLVQSRSIEQDARILLEETRELVIARDLQARLEELRAVAARASKADPTDTQRAAMKARLGRISATLSEVFRTDADPSRETHQEREDELLSRLQRDLDEYAAALEPGTNLPADLIPRLDLAVEFVGSLIAETRREYELAGADLERKNARTTRVVGAATAAAMALLVASSFLVLRGVVEPVRRLRAGADRFGRGDMEHRIRIDNSDELGTLADSFNEMAERTAEARADLESQVVDRTREFLRAARLADLGMLAAGVAHEINNPLATISACAEGLQRREVGGKASAEDRAEYLDIIRTESARAKAITGRLLRLSRQDADSLSEFELGLAMDHVEKAARYLMTRKDVALDLRVGGPETVVLGSAGELTQICLNLLSNAFDASPPGSTVVLECAVRGPEVRIRVVDHGHGIAADQLERVFEPFYTTKSPGSGTGLGLALVQAMVQSRGGRLSVESQPGAGTTFTVDMPLSWKTT